MRSYGLLSGQTLRGYLPLRHPLSRKRSPTASTAFRIARLCRWFRRGRNDLDRSTDVAVLLQTTSVINSEHGIFRGADLQSAQPRVRQRADCKSTPQAAPLRDSGSITKPKLASGVNGTVDLHSFASAAVPKSTHLTNGI